MTDRSKPARRVCADHPVKVASTVETPSQSANLAVLGGSHVHNLWIFRDGRYIGPQ